MSVLILIKNIPYPNSKFICCWGFEISYHRRLWSFWKHLGQFEIRCEGSNATTRYDNRFSSPVEAFEHFTRFKEPWIIRKIFWIVIKPLNNFANLYLNDEYNKKIVYLSLRLCMILSGVVTLNGRFAEFSPSGIELIINQDF